ncbi:MAG TPA: hypothetical protein VEP49_03505 [Acidimicrobiia bacterium]|nr:hypothetical protein [Acidimicrobiia bacterium]
MSAPTAAQRRQLDEHAAAELTFDVDATMRTVDDDPEYEWQPGNLAIRGRAETARMYAAFLPRWRELTETADLRFEVRSEFWSDIGRMREQVAFVRHHDGTLVRHDFVVVVLFGARGVKGERTYCSRDFARLTLGAYYEQIGSTPR